LNFELFIARGILSRDKNNFSRPIVRISILSIAVGMAVMIMSLAITAGFKDAISQKVIGFGSHVKITSFDLNKSFESSPVDLQQDFYPSLADSAGIRHIQVFATKSGLAKSEDQIHGVVLKGIWTDFDWTFFRENIVEGELIKIDPEKRTDDILISKLIADKLNFKLGDDVRIYFINPDEISPRGRKFFIKGIYETGLEEFDDLFIIGDLRHIQRLNKWDEKQVSGFEVFVDDFRNLGGAYETIYNTIPYQMNAESIQDLYPQIFDWLDLQDLNVIIILVLMIAVATINMVSTLLILILEKTNMIGILKALGTKNSSVRKVFIYNAIYIIGRGLFWGNLFGLGIAILQQQFGFIHLDQESYYVSSVPIQLNLLPILLLNVGTLAICILFLLVPSYIITKISPVKAIRWE
jgi:lipoprotein-releasing system permease protein